MGISEWMCYHANYDIPCSGVSDLDACLDAHVALGIDQIVWNAGRSVVDYWSDLPNVTRMCELNDQVGGISWSFVAAVMDSVCPLRYALSYCRKRQIPLLGRLGMNRHYGSTEYAGVTSRFALENPHYRERSIRGNEVAQKLCYAIEEVQQERLDILLEVQRIGVDALVLDFCRQMPILLYHDALIRPYIEMVGEDPRRIDSSIPEDYTRWFQYRADVLTEFMRKLRTAVHNQERTLGKSCPIIARIPDNAPWLTLAYGLDIERWFADDLIDGTMLSPFPISAPDPDRYPEYHIELAHRHGKVCYGGIGSRNLIQNGILENTGFFHPRPIYQLALRQYNAGADTMTLYQSETLVRMDYLKETLREIGDRRRVAQKTTDLPDPNFPPEHPIGLDWHSRLTGGHGLGLGAGDGAL